MYAQKKRIRVLWNEMYLDFQKIKPNFIGKTGKQKDYVRPKETSVIMR